MKRGTHWQPAPAKVAEAHEPLRPVFASRCLIAELQAKKVALELELQELFRQRRNNVAGLPIKRKSRQLREVKKQIAALSSKVQLQ